MGQHQDGKPGGSPFLAAGLKGNTMIKPNTYSSNFLTGQEHAVQIDVGKPQAPHQDKDAQC
jgi:hypothetical protein